LGDGGCHERGISIPILILNIVAIKEHEDDVIPRGRGCNVLV
jgi:hypothetical protein